MLHQLAQVIDIVAAGSMYKKGQALLLASELRVAMGLSPVPKNRAGKAPAVLAMDPKH